ncbi:hypothetical protein P7D59_18650 [Enterococcus avium]|uniref:hypothetical protein n=1 Tax=Enterococcus avium TaxID=33945 RepID=UPI00288CBBBF|nr:hypothetical protein [Enterococcus avium]MDT2480942.1 hypothetical protein [Enterococcus avium]
MKTYWYVSLNNKYPLPMKGQHKRVVMSVQMKAKYSIVEMIRELNYQLYTNRVL